MSNIVMSIYLTGRDDPQARWDPRPKRLSPNSLDVIENWERSLINVNANGVVFHDGLDDRFTMAVGSRWLSFLPAEYRTPWGPCEERVRIYRDFLVAVPFDWALMTDLSDVEFYKDPFVFMTDPGRLYIGSETETIGKSIVARWMKENYDEVTAPDKPILNPGIVGGHRNIILPFLVDWLEEMYKIPDAKVALPIDLAAFNRVLYRGGYPYVTGHPWHTTFRKYEGPESGAYVRHK